MFKVQLNRLKQDMSRAQIYISINTNGQYIFRQSFIKALNGFLGGDENISKSQRLNINLFIDFANKQNTREDMKALDEYLATIGV